MAYNNKVSEFNKDKKTRKPKVFNIVLAEAKNLKNDFARLDDRTYDGTYRGKTILWSKGNDYISELGPADKEAGNIITLMIEGWKPDDSINAIYQTLKRGDIVKTIVIRSHGGTYAFNIDSIKYGSGEFKKAFRKGAAIGKAIKFSGAKFSNNPIILFASCKVGGKKAAVGFAEGLKSETGNDFTCYGSSKPVTSYHYKFHSGAMWKYLTKWKIKSRKWEFIEDYDFTYEVEDVNELFRLGKTRPKIKKK